MFLMPDIPFAVLMLFVVGYIIYRIIKRVKKNIRYLKWELDNSPEAIRIKERDKEICRVTDLALSNQISDEEFKEELDRIDREYNYLK